MICLSDRTKIQAKNNQIEIYFETIYSSNHLKDEIDATRITTYLNDQTKTIKV